MMRAEKSDHEVTVLQFARMALWMLALLIIPLGVLLVFSFGELAPETDASDPRRGVVEEHPDLCRRPDVYSRQAQHRSATRVLLSSHVKTCYR